MHQAGLRRTPAGIAALRLKLAHAGAQHEAGHARAVALELEAVAFGQVAEALAGVPPGSALHLAGFIDRKGAQSAQLELHVTEFRLIEE